MTAVGDVGGTLFFSIIVIILIIALIYLIIDYIRKQKQARMEHVELYFDEHFRDVIKEWDLVKRPKMKDWHADMSKRLTAVGKDVDGLVKVRKSLDSRMDKLENEMRKLEIL